MGADSASKTRQAVGGGSDFAIASSYNDPQQKRGGYDMRSFAPSLLSALTLSVTMSAAAPVMA